MNTRSNDTQNRILTVGYELIVTKGFIGVGLSELLKSAEVPKGSFYHFFQSKEHFGITLIENYFVRYLEFMSGIFHQEGKNGYDRIIQYFNYWLETEDGRCNADKCLVVKLSAEVSDLSEDMRLAMQDGVDQIVTAMAKCIEVGLKDNSINTANSEQLAKELYQIWIGSSLLNKLYQDQSTLEQSMKVTKRLLQGN